MPARLLALFFRLLSFFAALFSRLCGLPAKNPATVPATGAEPVRNRAKELAGQRRAHRGPPEFNPAFGRNPCVYRFAGTSGESVKDRNCSPVVKMLFGRPFLLASAASLCQNTSTCVDEASLTKLGRNSWREAQGGTMNRRKKVPDTNGMKISYKSL